MIPAFYIFCLMVAVGVVLYLLDLRSRKKHPGQAAEPGGGQPAATPTCADTTCALHDLCPSEAIMQCAVSNEIVYYDDEELDAFKGRGARDYTEAEIEQFRDVLYTLKPADLLGWEQSVTKRGIVLPTSIRDEFIALYNDAKTSN